METCKLCSKEFKNKSEVMKHKWKDHRETIKLQRKGMKTVKVKTTDPLARIIQFEADVLTAIAAEHTKQQELMTAIKTSDARLAKLIQLASNLGIPNVNATRDFTKQQQ